LGRTFEDMSRSNKRRGKQKAVPLTGKRQAWDIDYRAKVLRDFGYKEDQQREDDNESQEEEHFPDKDETLQEMILPWGLTFAVCSILLKNYVEPLVLAILISVLAAIRFLHHVKVIYGNVKGWQITILTMHVAPIIVIKTYLQNSTAVYAIILAFQLAMDTPLNIWTVMYMVLQMVTVHLHELVPQRVEDVLIVLNVIIPTGFWAAVLFSGLFGDSKEKAFHTIDREMRKLGLFHAFVKVPVAFVREIWFHFLSQFLITSYFASRTSETSLYSRRFTVLRDITTAYIAWVCVCFVFSPKEMPYPVVSPNLFRGLALIGFMCCVYYS